MPSSFSLIAILDHFKVYSQLRTDFVARKQQQVIDQFETEKSLHVASTDNLGFMITDNRLNLLGNLRAIQLVKKRWCKTLGEDVGSWN